MTAEFVTVFPAVLLTLGLIFSGLQVFAEQIKMQQLAGAAARLLAVGESIDLLEEIPNHFNVSSFEQSALVCAEVGHEILPLKERACALKIN